MVKYEYLVQATGMKSEKDLGDHLNGFGQDGWDLVVSDNVNGFFRFIFKRQIQTPFIVGVE